MGKINREDAQLGYFVGNRVGDCGVINSLFDNGFVWRDAEGFIHTWWFSDDNTCIVQIGLKHYHFTEESSPSEPIPVDKEKKINLLKPQSKWEKRDVTKMFTDTNGTSSSIKAEVNVAKLEYPSNEELMGKINEIIEFLNEM